MSQVVIANPVGEELVEGLRSIGLDVHSPDKALTPELLSSQLEDASILIVTDTPVLRGAIERAASLALIVRVGEGPGKVDVNAASERGGGGATEIARPATGADPRSTEVAAVNGPSG